MNISVITVIMYRDLRLQNALNVGPLTILRSKIMRRKETVEEMCKELKEIYYKTPRIFFLWRRYLKGVIEGLEYAQNLRDIDPQYWD